MKYYSALLTSLLPGLLLAARQHPPSPRRGPGPPPGLPVDQYLIGLFILGLLLIIFFKHKLKTTK